MNNELQVVLEDSAREFLQEHHADTMTVDMQLFGGCIIVSEADVLLGPPEDLNLFEKYMVDGYTVYVFRTMKFEQNILHIYKKKGLLAKKGLEAGTLKQLG